MITKTESNIPIAFNLLAAILVLGTSKLNDSTTEIRSSRANCDKIERIPARYIFLLTFWLKFSSGLLGKVRPPPRHKGEPAAPARARPVPFWRHGLRVLYLTSERSFCARLPLRALA